MTTAAAGALAKELQVWRWLVGCPACDALHGRLDARDHLRLTATNETRLKQRGGSLASCAVLLLLVAASLQPSLLQQYAAAESSALEVAVVS